MNEIIITQLGALKCDFDGIRTKLDEKLELYRGMVFTEDSKKEAKNVVADLRKEKKEFTEQVKAIKTEYMKPYEAFYEKACELIDMYDQPINFINGQVEAFEAQRIEAKKEEIKKIYTELVPEEDMIDLIPLQRIYNKKWENATFSVKDIKEEIMTRKIQTKHDLELLLSFESVATPEAIARYKQTFDVASSIKFINDYEAQKRMIQAQEEERIRKETEERIRAEERAKIEAERKAEEEKAKAVEQAQAEVIESFIPQETGAAANEYSYIITLTPETKEKLEFFMNSVGIEFEELPV